MCPESRVLLQNQPQILRSLLPLNILGGCQDHLQEYLNHREVVLRLLALAAEHEFCENTHTVPEPKQVLVGETQDLHSELFETGEDPCSLQGFSVDLGQQVVDQKQITGRVLEVEGLG